MIWLELFLTFLKIGAFTFGGGYAMIPLIQSEVVSRNWMTDADLVNFIAVSESTPGPFAINISTYVGMEAGGLLGAFCATFGVVLPSFIIIILVAKCFAAFSENRFVKGVLSGLRPAVVGLISAAVISVGETVFSAVSLSSPTAFFTSPAVLSFIVFLTAAFLLFRFKWHPIAIIGLSGGMGILLCFIRDIFMPAA